MPRRQEHVNKVDWEVDLTAGEESGDGDDAGGLPRTHTLVKSN
jgi:hypothetical protein